MLIIAGALLLQESNKPYTDPIANKIEIMSLTVGVITIYSGIWYLSADIETELEIFLFVLMIIANLVFIVFWLITYLRYVPWAKKLR